MKIKFAKTLALASLSSLLLSACSSIYSEPPIGEEPSPLNFSREAQYQLSSTSHWNRVAEDMANRTLDSFVTGGQCLPGNELCSGDYSVKITSASTYFAEIFETQITSALVNNGLKVSRSGNSDYVFEVDIQVASFDREYLRRIDAPFRLFGPNGFLDKTGIWTVKDTNSTSVQRLRNREIQFSWAKDTHNDAWLNNPDDIPNTEIVITFSLINPMTDHYLARTTDMYYWKAGGRFLRELQRISGSRTLYGTSSSIRVVGDCTDYRCETQ